MHKIQNRHRFALGLITNILSITCFVIAFFNIEKIRFIISAILLLAFAVTNYYFAFRQKGVIEEISGVIDDHDRYIAMKSCQDAMQILNFILLGAILLSLVLYGALKLSVFLIIAVTLCSVLVLMFLLTLVVSALNSYPQ